MIQLKRSSKACLAICAAASVSGLSAFAAATVNVDSWTESEINNCLVTINGAAATVSFADTTASFPSVLGATVSGGSSSGNIAGDYSFAGVQSVNLTISADAGLSPNTRLQVKTATGNIWENKNLVAGVNSVGFGPGDGWILGSHASRNKYPNMQDELTDVVSIGLRVRPNNTEAQEVSISAFSVSSTVPIGSTVLEAALFTRFGVITAAEVTDNSDSDSDGMSDLHEILAENDDEFNSFMMANLTVDIVGLDGNGADLQWVHVKNKSYKILKSNSLTSDTFSELDETAPMAETGKTNFTFTDATATAEERAFYLIEQQ